jgi:hypothetical protein
MRFEINLKDVIISTMFFVGGLALIFLGKFVNMDILGICGSILFYLGILYFSGTVLGLEDILI